MIKLNDVFGVVITVYSHDFELENGVMTTAKRRSILSFLFDIELVIIVRILLNVKILLIYDKNVYVYGYIFFIHRRAL